MPGAAPAIQRAAATSDVNPIKGRDIFGKTKERSKRIFKAFV